MDKVVRRAHGRKAQRARWAMIILVVSLAALLTSVAGVAAAGTGYEFLQQWPTVDDINPGNGLFYAPSGVAVDAAGNVYVSDTSNHRIQKFNSSGTYLAKWGAYGSGNGQFSSPNGIAVDASGNVYVADTGNHRVQKFSSTGVYLAKWGSSGSTDGQFVTAWDIATDASGNVYVADPGAYRIQKFSGTGTFLTKWGSWGTADGSFKSPAGIAVDGTGNVYVADSHETLNRVQKFSSAGVFLAKWDSWDGGSSTFSSPNGVAVDVAGNVYVVDSGNSAIEEFTGTGSFVTSWTIAGTASSPIPWPAGVAVDSSGNVYVVDTMANRVQKFNLTTYPNGQVVKAWGSLGGPMVGSSAGGQFALPAALTLDAAGNLYVADSRNDRVQRFTSTWTHPLFGTSVLGSAGTGNGQLRWPSWVALDAAGNTYVVDSLNSRVQKFSSAGSFVTAWGSLGSGNGQFNSPSGIAVDASGYIYVVDSGNSRVQKFSNAGSFVTAWGSLGSGNGQLNSPSGIAVDASSNVYVVDSANSRVQKFRKTGAYVTKWGSLGSGNGEFNSPSGIAVDASGYVYVVDSGNSRVQKFNSTGTYISGWGSYGAADGSFKSPAGIAVDRAGDIYVSDSHPVLSRIQKFSGTGVFLAGWNSWNGGTTTLASPNGLAVDTAGNVYVADSGNDRVEKFISALGSSGSGNGQMSWPSGVAVDAGGNIFVADSLNNRVEKFSSTGAWLATWGSAGRGNGQFNALTGIALDAAGNLYTVESGVNNDLSDPNLGNNRIQKFSSTGAWLATWGSHGTGNGQFNSLSGIALDTAGNIYVVESGSIPSDPALEPGPGNNRIQKFSNTGAWLATWGSPGSEDGQLNGASGIAVDTAGSVYVVESGNNRVQKLSSTGTFLTRWGSNGSGSGYFNSPSGVAVDASGLVYVADTQNQRIQVFNPPPDLVVTSLTAPSAVNSGEAISVTWTVENQGTTNARPSWEDRVYFSTDDTWDSSDIYLTRVTRDVTLTAGSGYSVTTGETMPRVSAGTYYLIQRTDMWNQVPESNETNNVQAVPIIIRAPDLTPTAFLTPVRAEVGWSVPITWTIKNLGTSDASPTWYDRVYLSTDEVWDSADVLVTNVTHTLTLTVGSSYSVNQSVTIPWVSGGNYYLILRTDMWNNVTESDEINNEWAVPLTVGIPDLTPTAFTAPSSAIGWQVITPTWTIKNQGHGDAPPSWQDRIYLSTDTTWDSGDTWLTTVTHTVTLTYASSYSVTQSAVVPKVTSGSYYLLLRADMWNAVSELDETNNPRVLSIDIGPPDLTPTAFTSQAAAKPGQTIPITWTVKNQGLSDTLPTWYDRVYLSTDGTYDSGDVFMVNVTRTFTLLPGSSYTTTRTVMVPGVAAGSYYLILRTDMWGNVTESDATNNQQVVPLTVGVPDLTPAAFTAPATGRPWQIVPVTWTVKNQGPVETLPSWEDRVYLSTDATWDSGDIFLTKITHSATVAAGDSYTVSANVTLPGTGTHYLIFRTDMWGQVAELNETNNSTAVGITVAP